MAELPGTTLRALVDAATARTDAQLRAFEGQFAKVWGKALRESGDVGFDAIWQREDVQQAIDRSLTITESRILQDLRAGALAARKLAEGSLKQEGITYSAPAKPDYLTTLLGDVGTYLQAARHDYQTSMREAFNRAPKENRGTDTRAAIGAQTRRLAVRVRASNSVVVTRSYNETKTAGYLQAGESPRLIWLVTSANPCPRCLRLNGTEVDGSEIPPLHPHCACVIMSDA